MNFDDQLELEHLLFTERKCRTCEEVKDLVQDFYLIRKEKNLFHHLIHMNVKFVQ